MFAAPNFFQTGGGNVIRLADVFSATTYNGNGTSQTITNGINLSGKGGLVWSKSRSGALPTARHALFDTERGVDKLLSSNLTNAQATVSDEITAFNSNGYDVGANLTYASTNYSGNAYVSWTFRKEPKFFDIVTWTGTGGDRTISHSLGSTPGCIIVKRTNNTAGWYVYHRSSTYGQNGYLLLNDTNAESNIGADVWTPTSTTFQANSTYINLNLSGGTYVAYVFAHDAGGFGSTGTDNAISCGGYTGNGGSLDINLGYQPQFVIVKRTDTLYSWQMYDTSRGFNSSDAALLAPNLSDAESTITGSQIYPTSTGFTVTSSFANTGGGTYVYIAIRANS